MEPVSTLHEASVILNYKSEPLKSPLLPQFQNKRNIVYYLFEDDIENVIKYISNRSDIKERLVYTPFQQRNYIEMAAEFGAIKSFKFLLKSGFELNTNETLNVPRLAVVGGNEDILEIVLDAGYDISFYINDAVEFRNNSIVDYILNNYENHPKISIFRSASGGNLEAVYYCVSNGVNINSIHINCFIM